MSRPIVGEAERALDEFLIAVVGPVSSFVLAGVFWLVGRLAPLDGTPLGSFVSYLASVNLILGVFNLAPGFPLDGGRVLRSIVWASTGSLRRATQVASYVGQGFGFVLIFWGVARLLSGDVFGGLWTAFIGWFLNSGAESTRQQQALTEDLRRVEVAQVMDPQPTMAEPSMTVHDFVYDYVIRRGERALLVAEAGQLLGIVTITDAKEVPQELWAATPRAPHHDFGAAQDGDPRGRPRFSAAIDGGTHAEPGAGGSGRSSGRVAETCRHASVSATP